MVKQPRPRPAGKATPKLAPAHSSVETVARHRWRQALLLGAVAIAVRGLHFWAMRNSLLYQALICDCGQYDKWAERIAGGDWIGHEVFYQTPLYPYLLATVYKICGHSIWAVRFLQAGFAAVSCYALARAGTNFFSERVGWIAGLLLALYPPAIFFDGILQKASLDLLLMTSLLGVLGALQQRPRKVEFIFAGLLLGAMSLNRENAAALFPLLLVWIVWLSWPQHAIVAMTRAAFFIAGVGAILLPVGLRNYYVGGAFLVTTAQMGPNLYIGNHRGADGGYTPMRAGRGEPEFEGLDARLLAEDDLRRPLTSAEVSRYWLSRTVQDVRSAPVEWLRLLGWKWFLTWNATEMIDAESIHTHQLDSPVLAILNRLLHFGILCPLAVLGICWTCARWRELWILYAMLATFALAVTAFYVFARYRYPLVPVAVLFAAAGLYELCEVCRAGPHRRSTSYWLAVPLCAAVALFCNWPVRQRFADDAVTYYNTGSTLLAMGRTADGIAMLHRAIDIDPTFPDAYNNLGREQLNLGQLAEARGNFEKAIAADDRQAIFHVNLANVAIKQGEKPLAIEQLRRAIQLDPLLVPAYGPLAELEFSQGEVAAATEHLRRAVELQTTAAGRTDLAMVLSAQGKPAEAIAELERALEIDQAFLPAQLRLAWLLATTDEARLRNGAVAVRLADQACRATEYRQASALEVLAAALAETGDFVAAAQRATEAAALARAQNQTEFAAALEARVQLFRQKKPFRAGAAGAAQP